MRNRGLLTRGDREALRDGIDEEKLHDLRWNVRKRMERIEEDLEILEEAGEEELVDEFYDEFGVGDLARRVRELEKGVNDGDSR